MRLDQCGGRRKGTVRRGRLPAVSHNSRLCETAASSFVAPAYPVCDCCQLRDVDGGEFAKVISVFRSFGWDVHQEAWFETVNELRLLANSVKHTRGKSVGELRKLTPTLFYPLAILADGEIWDEEPDGNDLVPAEADFRRYVAGLLAFWAAIPQAAHYF